MSEVRLLLAQRAMLGDWTDEEVLIMAKGRVTLSVSKYAVRDLKILEAARRLQKAGKLRFVCEDRGVLFWRAV